MQTCHHPLRDASPLKLRNRPEHMQLEATRWRGGINALREAYEGHTECMEFIEEENQVAQVPSEANRAASTPRRRTSGASHP
jgi:hypothetical protein